MEEFHKLIKEAREKKRIQDEIIKAQTQEGRNVDLEGIENIGKFNLKTEQN